MRFGLVASEKVLVIDGAFEALRICTQSCVTVPRHHAEGQARGRNSLTRATSLFYSAELRPGLFPASLVFVVLELWTVGVFSSDWLLLCNPTWPWNPSPHLCFWSASVAIEYATTSDWGCIALLQLFIFLLFCADTCFWQPWPSSSLHVPTLLFPVFLLYMGKTKLCQRLLATGHRAHCGASTPYHDALSGF